MINRRHIRVKVMQSAYAMLKSGSDNLAKEEKFLLHSIDKMYDLYLLKLDLLVRVRDMARNDIEISKKKHLASKEELNPNTKFIDNSVLKILAESTSLTDKIEERKITNWNLDDEYVRLVLNLIKESDFYVKYMENAERSEQEDKTFVINVFKHIIAPNEKLEDYFEDQFLGWVDDIPFVNTWIMKNLKKIKTDRQFVVDRLYKDMDDERFVLNLFRRVILHHDKYGEEIADKTPNWDTDRIADMDMLLIKMAICEFLKFPSIPVRVTINEYIEISKDYSTKKSSYFINGVLDKLQKEFSDSKRIEKIGRGLL
ncbi:transcription antitermination factor NusB [Aureivirga sp. CE67]|uniref:transcription antitermination factor NusB n=1 Tax=Aureivirga sp. CE67 TaxID=1788983 RepID=UPI0018CBC32C|nr:transcription antitermination factor NusB [Aureivirga sp. CE67]